MGKWKMNSLDAISMGNKTSTVNQLNMSCTVAPAKARLNCSRLAYRNIYNILWLPFHNIINKIHTDCVNATNVLVTDVPSKQNIIRIIYIFNYSHFIIYLYLHLKQRRINIVYEDKI